ncbi:hypothetical protein VTL71DRAFT_6913 [Oculimacula yallundae]|uniref:Uncharacterized protein n=1 Tax=Oculimacula yallundae TaxID=86028 RepID=A0ABR4BWD3_9HELO
MRSLRCAARSSTCAVGCWSDCIRTEDDNGSDIVKDFFEMCIFWLSREKGEEVDYEGKGGKRCQRFEVVLGWAGLGWVGLRSGSGSAQRVDAKKGPPSEICEPRD